MWRALQSQLGDTRATHLVVAIPAVRAACTPAAWAGDAHRAKRDVERREGSLPCLLDDRGRERFGDISARWQADQGRGITRVADDATTRETNRPIVAQIGVVGLPGSLRVYGMPLSAYAAPHVLIARLPPTCQPLYTSTDNRRGSCEHAAIAPHPRVTHLVDVRPPSRVVARFHRA